MLHRHAQALMVLVLATGACSDETELGGEPSGSAEYLVRNDASHELTIECVATSGSPVDCEAGPFSATPGATVELGSDAAFGNTPSPPASLDEVSALAVPPGGTDPVVVYTQQPVESSLWQKELLNDAEYADARYTLALADTDLTFPP